MKTIPPALQAALNKPVVNLAVCWKMTRGDGQVFAFTTHDKSLTVSAVAYEPTNAFSESGIEQKADMSVDNLDMVALTSSTITEGDLLGGKFDNASLDVFVVDWSDTSLGTVSLLRGKIGEVETRGAQFRAEVRGMAQAIQQDIVKQTSITCRAKLGDAQCKVRASTSAWAASTVYGTVVSGDAGIGGVVRPGTYNGFFYKATTGGTSGGSEPTWPTVVASTVTDGGVTWETFNTWTKQGTVTQFHDRTIFRDASLTQADGWYQFGKVTWTSGANDGIAMEVREFVAGGYVTLWEPMPFDIAVGNTFDIQTGCAKRVAEDCKTKFDNVKNFDGEPFLPGEDAAAEFPDAR
jgi:uncharacterized phage protein (TIGR02218 family)